MKKKLLAMLVCFTLLLSLVTATALAGSMKIKFGDEGSQVRQAQVRLTQLGFNPGLADAKFGYTTFLAVKAFQKMNSLTVDGIIGELTVVKLYSDSAVNSSGAVTTSTYAIRLSYGSQGPDVSLLQEALRTLGYYTGPVEGGFGYSTFLAVKAFQLANGLTVDGVVGPQTWQAIGAGSTVPTPPTPPAPAPVPEPVLPLPDVVTALRLQYGDKTAAVAQLQSRLNDLGYTGGAADGTFGYTTYLAVRSFQYKNALKVDGVVGPLTWNRLFSAMAI